MTIFRYDPTYEMCFDGELGSLISLDAHGHLDARDVEMFMATAVADEFYDTLDFGFEVECLWRTEHPYVDDEFDAEEIGERWTYHYNAAETDGAIAVTRFQVASPWAFAGDARSGQVSSADAESPLRVTVAGVRQRVCPTCGNGTLTPPSKWSTTARCDGDDCSYQLPPKPTIVRRGSQYARREDFDGWGDRFPLMCINHPDEPATTGIPAEQVIDADDAAIDGSVHMCHPCSKGFQQRMAKARQLAMAPLNIARFLDGIERSDPEWERRGHTLPLAFFRGLLEGTSDAIHRGRDFTETWKRQFPESTVVARAPGNYAILSIRDIEALSEQEPRKPSRRRLRQEAA